MERFPRIPEEQLDPSQKNVKVGVDRTFARNPGVEYKDADGKYCGPYNQLYYTPDLVSSWFAHGGAVAAQRIISARERELAVLATLSVYETPFVRYAHGVTARAAGLSDAQVAEALRGITPTGLTEVEAAMFDASRAVALCRGPLAPEHFDRALRHMDRQQFMALTHTVMSYAYICTMANVGDGNLPPAAAAAAAAQKDA